MGTPLGDYLRKLRTDLGLSLRDVEAKSDVNFAYVANLEQGKSRKPNAVTLRKLATAYGVDVRTLLDLAAGAVTPSDPAADTIGDILVTYVRQTTHENREKLLSLVKVLDPEGLAKVSPLSV